MSDDKNKNGLTKAAANIQAMFKRKNASVTGEGEPEADGSIGTDKDPSQAPLMEHIKELRQRLFVFVGVFFLLTIGAFFLAKPIYLFLAEPIVAVFEKEGLPTVFIVTSPFEKFFSDFSLALFVGFTLTMPVMLYQIWRFVAPGLYNNEKGAMRPFLVASPILFVVGLAFIYYVVMPMAFNFLIGYAVDGGETNLSRTEAQFLDVVARLGAAQTAFEAIDLATASKEVIAAAANALLEAQREFLQLRPLDAVTIDPQTKIADYLRDSMRMLIGGGVGFQLPVALTLMVRSGLVSTDFLKKNRRFAVLILFILSGVLTPPDIISQALLGGPMYLLYEASIFIGGRIEAYQRANNPYWDGGNPDDDPEGGDDDGNGDDDAEEADDGIEENSIFHPSRDQRPSARAVPPPGEEDLPRDIFAIEDDEPQVLDSTPAPEGDEGFVEPDPDEKP